MGGERDPGFVQGPVSSQQLPVRKAEVGPGAIAYDDVIENRDAKEFARFDQALCQAPVFLAGLRIAAGVIMAHNDGGSVAEDGWLVHFSRMNQTGRQRAYRHRVDSDQAVLAIEGGVPR